MPRPNTTGPGFKSGDLIFDGGEWVVIFAVQSTATWQLFRPSTGTVAAGPQDLTAYLPSLHRTGSIIWPPKPTGAN